MLESIISELEHLKKPGADWCSLVEETITMLSSEHDITMRRNSTRRDTTMSEYRDAVAIPYIDTLVSNINCRFSELAVNVLVSSSIFNP